MMYKNKLSCIVLNAGLVIDNSKINDKYIGMLKKIQRLIYDRRYDLTLENYWPI